MPAEKPRPTLADYVTVLISPALIIAMIVSLVFFLLAVLYRGEFVNRLHIILFFFIFGIVLVARIAMETGYSERAPIYGGVLAVLVWIGIGNFVNYPSELAGTGLINACLIALAWWLAQQLTHSCTYIDEKAETTGTGVLQAAGLEQSDSLKTTQTAQEKPLQQAGKRTKAPKPSWWERYRRFREMRQKTQPPGVWVVYFAVAALPIFGLGQALIDAADKERRAHTFRLMALYLTSALGLLATTAFLGLRRYLRQRRLEMPKMVTSAWLVVGTVLLASLVLIGALLPRPRSEFSLLDLGRADSNELFASKVAITPGETGKGKGQSGAQENDPDGAPASGKDTGRGGSAGKGKYDKGKTKEASAKGTNNSKAQDPEKKSGESHDAQNKPEREQTEESQTGGTPDQQTTPPDDSGASSFLNNLLSDVSKLLKWIVFGMLIVVTLFFVLGGGLKYLANFTDWARRLLEALRRFWEGLFGPQLGGAAREVTAAGTSANTRVPFGSFANPFQDGRAAQMTPGELVKYSFEALEAWAGDSACERAIQETPIEFANRMADEVGVLDSETKHLGILYAGVLYARGALPPTWRDTLENFWTRIAMA